MSLSIDDQLLVRSMHEEGMAPLAIVKQTKFTPGNVARVIRAFRLGLPVAFSDTGGCPRKISVNDNERILSYLKQFPNATSSMIWRDLGLDYVRKETVSLYAKRCKLQLLADPAYSKVDFTTGPTKITRTDEEGILEYLKKSPGASAAMIKRDLQLAHICLGTVSMLARRCRQQLSADPIHSTYVDHCVSILRVTTAFEDRSILRYVKSFPSASVSTVRNELHLQHVSLTIVRRRVKDCKQYLFDDQSECLYWRSS